MCDTKFVVARIFYKESMKSFASLGRKVDL
jgi:hypothetical protein